MRVLVVAVMCLGFVATGCETVGSARIVKRSKDGGVVALKGDRSKAMKDARKRMRKACKGPFTIVEESEEVVGRNVEEHVEEETRYSRGRAVTGPRSRYEEREVRETRITYECGESEGIDVADAAEEEEESEPVAKKKKKKRSDDDDE